MQRYHTDEFEKKATNYCIRFLPLVTVRNQLPMQVVNNIVKARESVTLQRDTRERNSCPPIQFQSDPRDSVTSTRRI